MKERCIAQILLMLKGKLGTTMQRISCNKFNNLDEIDKLFELTNDQIFEYILPFIRNILNISNIRKYFYF